jgi:hypothetical protein
MVPSYTAFRARRMATLLAILIAMLGLVPGCSGERAVTWVGAAVPLPPRIPS